jgi:hypothetical protein
MGRRKLLLGVGTATLLVLAGHLLLPLLPRPGAGITPDNYERIQVGMTEKEVEAVLGARAGDYSGGRAYFPASEHRPRIPRAIRPRERGFGPDETLHMWAGDEVAVYVWFDGAGRAVDKMLRPLRPDGGPWDRLRRLLPW